MALMFIYYRYKPIIVVFWVVMLCSFVSVYRRLGGICCHHLQDLSV
jgi:hypothetical protein